MNSLSMVRERLNVRAHAIAGSRHVLHHGHEEHEGLKYVLLSAAVSLAVIATLIGIAMLAS